MASDQPDGWSVRAAEPSDVAFLRRMLHEALYVPDGDEPFPESILDQPELHRYVAGFGTRPGDLGVIALSAERPIGACWLRRFPHEQPGYGWVDDDTPELSIAIVPDARRHGLGTTLIETLLQQAADHGVRQVSLSVDHRSPARRLYERLGFEQVGRLGTSITMVRTAARP